MTIHTKIITSIICDTNYSHKKILTDEKLPPTLDSFSFHPILELPGPVGNGWVKNGEILE